MQLKRVLMTSQKKRRREADAFMDDLPSFCSMLCIFTRHGRREKEEADDEGRHAEERSGIADVSDSRIRADDAEGS